MASGNKVTDVSKVATEMPEHIGSSSVCLETLPTGRITGKVADRGFDSAPDNFFAAHHASLLVVWR